MSQNHWETQPRKDNGEFTFRYEFWKEKLKALEELNDSPEVSKQYDGGSYYALRKKYAGRKDIHIHHTPADSISPLSRNKGPCIAISSKEHADTSSYRNSSKAKAYRMQQEKLINAGRFLDAEALDFLDIIRISGNKYAKAMLEKLEYDKLLYNRGEING